MSHIDTTLRDTFEKKWLREQPVKTLFKSAAIVLAGDDLSVFYLDPWATSTAHTVDLINNPFVPPIDPWGTRDRKTTNIKYMELVYAAHENGIKDVVIDMSPDMQQGIDEAQSIYFQKIMDDEEFHEIFYNTLLQNDIATPMDAVVQISSGLGMKVHALNVGLTGLATFFRQAKGFQNLPQNLSAQERANLYLQETIKQDRDVLAMLLRREPTEGEMNSVRYCAKELLTDKKQTFKQALEDESLTAHMIHKTIQSRPFLGLFQKERLFTGENDLESNLRKLYADDEITTVSMHPESGETFSKPPHYNFHYALRNCTVSLTEPHAKHLRTLKQICNLG